MKKLISLAFLLLVTAGCSTPKPQLIKSIDPYTKEAGVAFGPIAANLCPGGRYDGVFTQVSILKSGGLQVLDISVEGQGWTFLNDRLPLNILIDGRAHKLLAIEGAQRDTKRTHGYVTITESLFYPVTESFVSRLARAQNVQFRVSGDKRSIERCLEASSLKQLEQVLPFLSP